LDQNKAQLVLDSTLCVARFTLAPNCQDKYGVEFCNVAIQGHVAVSLPANNQLTISSTTWTTDAWIGLEHVQDSDDFADSFVRKAGLMGLQVVKNSQEVLAYLGVGCSVHLGNISAAENHKQSSTPIKTAPKGGKFFLLSQVMESKRLIC
jgi:hypothetical protein